MKKPFNSTKEFIDHVIKKSATKEKVYKITFWLVSLFALFFGFFSAMMGVAKLASSRLVEFEGFAKLFVSVVDGKPVDQWPIFTLWIGIALAIINGLLALFVVKGKWLRNEKINNLISLEKLLYECEEGKYASNPRKDILFFDTVSNILGISYTQSEGDDN
ncbi:DUF4231 domain-containing protein [Mycoplasma procyoni]|uniref:DUF4231 domain-containing protein n=1 Tax=Mycoplasma procyoni TaxID=568784 RepID=UPI001F095577|nr:DUF4231 domain-containing protein [Mycoplasma procyoni]